MNVSASALGWNAARAIGAAALAIAATFTSGCASHLVVSSTAKRDTVSTGTSYSLPQQLVEVQLTPDPKVALESAASSREVAAADLTERDKDTKAFEQKLKQAKNEAEKAEVQKQLTEAEDRRLKAEALLTYWESRLERARAAVKSATAPGPRLSLTLLPLSADPNYHFVADLNHKGFRNDKLTLKTTQQGLLSGAVGYSEDQTLGTLNAILATIAAGKSSAKVLSAKVAPSCADLTEARVWKIDPTDPDQRAEVNNELKRYCFEIAAHVLATDTSEPPKPNKLLEKVDPKLKDGNNVFGLFYRRSEPWSIDLLSTETKQRVAYDVAFIPNRSPISLVPFKTGGLTKSEYDVEFTDGMLTKMDATRPSEALAAASLPLSAVRAVIGSVTDLIQLKVDFSSKNKAAVEAQTAMIKALTDLEAARQEAEKKSSAEPGTPPPTP